MGQGGNITVNASESISMTSASGLFSITNNAGTGGNISISAPSLTMDGAGTTIASLGSFGDGPGGASGAIAIHAGGVTMTEGAVINSVLSTTSPGISAHGGNITVHIDGEANIGGIGTGIGQSRIPSQPGRFYCAGAYLG